MVAARMTTYVHGMKARSLLPACLAILPLLASCAPTPQLQARQANAQSVVGQNTIDVLRRDGTPNRVYSDAGQQHFVYVEHRIIPYPIPLDMNQIYWIRDHGPFPVGTFGPRPATCRTDFAVQNGKIAGYSLHGECS
jgi:hypothetical protein